MSKKLQDLPVVNFVPPNSYMLIKYEVDSKPLDHHINITALFQNLVSLDRLGTSVGNLPPLVDVGSGVAGFPAVSGELLTNLEDAIGSGSDSASGLVTLSDAVDSGSNVNQGVAATPNAVRQVNNLNVKKTGDSLQGPLALDNTVSLNGLLSDTTTTVNIAKVNVSDRLELGSNSLTGADFHSGGSYRLHNSAGDVIFEVVETGAVTSDITFTGQLTVLNPINGLDSADIPVSLPSLGASNVEGALQELADKPVGLDWETPTAGPFTAEGGHGYFIEGGFNIFLPAGQGSSTIAFSDYLSVQSEDPVILVPDGAETIQGESQYALETSGVTVELVFEAGDWKVVNTSNPNVPPSFMFSDEFDSGSAYPYTLTYVPVNTYAILVTVDGVTLPPSSYTLNGADLTITSGQPTACEVRHLGVRIPLGTVPTGSVGTAQLQNEAVTKEKLDSGL